MTPTAVKQAERAPRPVDHAVIGVQRTLNKKGQATLSSPGYRHGGCPVNHRTHAAAAKCRSRQQQQLVDAGGRCEACRG